MQAASVPAAAKQDEGLDEQRVFGAVQQLRGVARALHRFAVAGGGDLCDGLLQRFSAALMP